MPKKKPVLDANERAHDLALEGKTQAAKSVLRVERYKAAERSGGNDPTITIVSPQKVMETVDNDIYGFRTTRDRKPKKG